MNTYAIYLTFIREHKPTCRRFLQFALPVTWWTWAWTIPAAKWIRPNFSTMWPCAPGYANGAGKWHNMWRWRCLPTKNAGPKLHTDFDWRHPYAIVARICTGTAAFSGGLRQKVPGWSPLWTRWRMVFFCKKMVRFRGFQLVRFAEDPLNPIDHDLVVKLGGPGLISDAWHVALWICLKKHCFFYMSFLPEPAEANALFSADWFLSTPFPQQDEEKCPDCTLLIPSAREAPFLVVSPWKWCCTLKNWLVVSNIFYFPFYIWDNPSLDFHIFQDG